MFDRFPRQYHVSGSPGVQRRSKHSSSGDRKAWKSGEDCLITTSLIGRMPCEPTMLPFWVRVAAKASRAWRIAEQLLHSDWSNGPPRHDHAVINVAIR